MNTYLLTSFHTLLYPRVSLITGLPGPKKIKKPNLAKSSFKKGQMATLTCYLYGLNLCLHSNCSECDRRTGCSSAWSSSSASPGSRSTSSTSWPTWTLSRWKLLIHQFNDYKTKKPDHNSGGLYFFSIVKRYSFFGSVVLNVRCLTTDALLEVLSRCFHPLSRHGNVFRYI